MQYFKLLNKSRFQFKDCVKVNYLYNKICITIIIDNMLLICITVFENIIVN